MNDIFINDNFLLQNPQAIELYHRFARDLPIIDYHCHLPADDVADDRKFENLTQIWLSGDHYKWRAMRAGGIDERFLTGDASDWGKFEKWAAFVPSTLRNPLFHWTHLELKRPFGISDRFLSPDTARGIWDECAAMLATDEFSSRGIMRQMNVALCCTTDDPTDSLDAHRTIANDDSFNVQVLPTFRPDKAMAVEDAETFNAWVDLLAERSGIEVKDFATFLDAIRNRHDWFHDCGCRLSDHGLSEIPDADYTESDLNNIFRRVSRGNQLGPDEIEQFRSAMLYEFGLMNHEKGWSQQLHIGPIRNTNSRGFAKLGPDAGYDSMGDPQIALPLAKLLDRLDRDDRLAKTILYNINPAHNGLLATMIGNFQDGQTAGKIQWGSGWWFLDQREGMIEQLNWLSNQALLSQFVGMLTDSRSLLSYTRHEYFRRIVCNLLGEEIRQGLLPNDIEWIGRLVRDICYCNAAQYFGFDLPVDPTT
jgi:glucuronate isomerase